MTDEQLNRLLTRLFAEIGLKASFGVYSFGVDLVATLLTMPVEEKMAYYDAMMGGGLN